MKYIYVDGGCSNNQDPAQRRAYGSFLIGDQPYPDHLKTTPVTRRFNYANATNNAAEYYILINALNYCIKHKIPGPHIFTDSALVVNQLSGKFKTNVALLRELRDKAAGLIAVTSATIEWITRDIIEGVLGH